MDNSPKPTRRLARREVLQTASAAGIALALPQAGTAAPAKAPAAPPAPQSPRKWPVRPLKAERPGASLDFKALAKPAAKTLVVDDMETNQGWTASDVVTLGYSGEHVRSGTRALRFAVDQRNADYIKANRRGGGFSGAGVLFDNQPFAASVRLPFATPQDWSAYNRISMWCYLHPSRSTVTSLALEFTCEGAPAGPADPIAVHYIGDLKPGAWNHLTWEIPEHRRDRIKEFVIFIPVAGDPFKDMDTRLTFDLDQFHLESVTAEPVEGWAVSPGKIAFSHLGYQRGEAKVALVGDAHSSRFQLLDAASGKVAADLPVVAQTTAIGRYGRLDFTGFTKPGRYRLRCEAVVSEAFDIRDDVWRGLIEDTLNSFYGFRCGFAVPGAHDCCHLDNLVTYKGETRTAAGGWHDAANLTQHAANTHQSIYALLQLYEQLEGRKADAGLQGRVLEEALWGLEWSQRMRFGPGLRCASASPSYWTDSVVGTEDDVLQTNVGRDLFENTTAVIASACGARLLARAEPAMAKALLGSAVADYATVIEDFTPPPAAQQGGGQNKPAWKDQIAYVAMAAVEMFKATGERRYADDAARVGRQLLAQQERHFVDGIGVAGYFYEDLARTSLVHEFHNGFEDNGLIALQGLCEILPDHPDWMEWYSGLLIYSEHYCLAGAKASAPFDVVPAAVWRASDISQPAPVDRMGATLAAVSNPLFPSAPTPELNDGQRKRMYDEGTKLGPNHRLRVFPLWPDHIRHGASNIQLAKAAGLAAAARARRSAPASALATTQLQWTVGANPFSRSIIYGVGYDYWQNFSVSLPSLVGGMSLGFNSYNGDAPAWGNNAVFPYKEQWIFSNCRVALLLASVGMPARVRGRAKAGAAFHNPATGATVKIRPGAFDISLPAGDYELTFGAARRTLTVVDGGDYELALDDAHWLALALKPVGQGGDLAIEAAITGSGQHSLDLRLFNAATPRAKVSVTLQPGASQTLRWPVTVKDRDMAWIVVAVPNGALSERVEVSGVARALNPIG